MGRRGSPQTTAALDLMIALREQGHGFRKIAAKHNVGGVPTTHGGPWRPDTVRAVLLRHADRVRP
jgi:Recombinase